MSLIPEGYDEISRHLLIDQNGSKSTIKVYANLPSKPDIETAGGCPLCEEKEKELQEINGAKLAIDKWIITDIYYSPGCTTCEEFINKDIPLLEKEINKNITIIKHNILEPNQLQELESKLKVLNIPLKAFPIIIVNDNVLQGSNVNNTEFNKILEGEKSKVNQTGFINGAEYLKPLPIFLAGLLDGVNPCAFTTLLFLISSLFYIGRGKKEIFKIGLIFTITIFISYYLVGLGLLNVVRTANIFPIISAIIKYILIFALILLSIFSFHDAYKVKKGIVNEMKLQLPKNIKKRIHNVIRANTRNRGMIIGTVIIGIMVTIFELTCTGQVYLPIIAYIIKIEGTISSYLYLTLYNIGFIIPLIIVFITVYRGTTNQKLMIWFSNKLFLIKILLGLLFLTMIFFM